MKTCVSTYSFYRLRHTMSFFEIIEKTKELGFDAIEFCLDDDLPGGRDGVAKLRARCEEVGLEIASYTTGANFFVPDQAAEIARVKEHVDRAAILGAPALRHDVYYAFYPGYTGLRTFDTALDYVVPAVREIAEYAASKGIRTMTENHGHQLQDSLRMEKLFNAVNHPNYGWLCDIGNFCCADEDSAAAVGRLAPLCIHVHAKDMFLRSGMLPDPGRGWARTRAGNYFRGTIFGQGNIPTMQCLQILKDSGYDGYVSLEFEGMEDTLQSIEISLENMKRTLAALK